MTGDLIGRGRERKISLSLYTHTKERPCEHTARKQLFASQEESLHQKPAVQELDLELLSLQNCEKINLCCLSHPICDILLWQPELTNIEGLGVKSLVPLSLPYA